MDPICSTEPCPVILNSTCVFYEGANLLYTGINTNDSLQTALQKINTKFQEAAIGYIFDNGVFQPGPGLPVGLGGTMNEDTIITAAGFDLTYTGDLYAGKHITIGGTSSDFVKGDGSLDNTPYQPAGNYISALTGDGTATGPGSTVLTLATVNTAPGTYGSSTQVPRITVDGKGRVTNITPVTISVPSASLSFIGDVTGIGMTGSPVTLTLAPVNSNVYGSNSFLKFAVNGKGLVTSAAPITNFDIESVLGYIPVPSTRTLTINSVTYNLSANRGWSVGTVTSVGVTMPSAFTVGAPVTSSGNINVTANGLSSQYIRGDGTLGNFAAGTSGTSGVKGTSGTSGYSGDRYKTTSTSQFQLGTESGIVVDSGLSYTPAQSIIIVYNASNFQESEVISYDQVTGYLVFSTPTRTVGSGIYNFWTVNLDGASGGDGSSGTSGITGTSGLTGTSGTAGSSGLTGTSGTSASSGSSGTSGGDVVIKIAISGTQNNSNKTFTLASTPTGSTQQFFINGQLLNYTDDYIVSGTTLTISSDRPAPTATDVLTYFGALGATGIVNVVIINTQVASYTLDLTDASKLIQMNVASANTVTVPLNSSIPFPIGTVIDVFQYGAGQTSFVATGGVTIRSVSGFLKINAQYQRAALTKINTNEWLLTGNLAV